MTPSLHGGGSTLLLGGSFNPPHGGHLEITERARRAIGADRAWWLVTPGNPLKNPKDYAPLGDRRAAAARLASGRPWLTVTDIEARLGTRYTVDTLAALGGRFPGTSFVWLMGADSLMTFHRWRDWRGIAARVPIAVVSRPGHKLAARRAPAARALETYRLPAHAARRLPSMKPPAWVFLPIAHNPLSSSEIRALANP